MGKNFKLDILQILQKERNRFISASELASLLKLSERTIYRHIKLLNKDLEEKGIKITSTPGLGYQLIGISKDSERLLLSPASNDINLEGDVQNFIVENLLNNCMVSLESILSTFFISESTLYRIIYSINLTMESSKAKIGIKKANIVLKGSNLAKLKFLIGILLSSELNHSTIQYKNIIEDFYRNRNNIKVFLLEDYFSKKLLRDFDRKILEWALFIKMRQTKKRTLRELIQDNDISILLNEFEEINGLKTKEKLFNIVDSSLAIFLSDSFRRENSYSIYVNNLVNHLQTLIKQKSNALYVENKLLSRITEEYPLEYQVSGLMAYQIELAFNLPLNKHDVGFVTLYLATINRNNEFVDRSISTVIISDSLSTGFLCREKVQNYLPMLEVIEVLPEWEVENHDFKKYDLIINLTSSNISEEIPLITISNPFDHELIKQIETKVRELNVIPLNQLELISQDVVILSGKNKEEIIATLLDVEIKNTAEKQIIKRQIIEREKITSTEIGNKVAIPHTIVNKLNETKIIIGIHEEGIIWSKEKVKVIILILFSDKTVAQEQLIRKIYNFTRNTDKLDEFIQNKELRILQEYVKGEHYGSINR
ncbi:PTS sugar transporter subunit IIA [uncultured Granulicatella sp.]|jgi:putative phosphoenolpyruvate-dependent sugar phosphotransferase system, EIIA 2|uniref:BglG family transcription antiterminator n=1 Tax=uncultured Granulicatella sp. TaxID=316089 RepID=UPI0028E964B5|nr:PTS sugar transporter subunit IIA [uncultured Granulicatella sp.]